jgi:hypothetical protein
MESPPTEEAEALIPMESRSRLSLSGPTALRRKAATRSEPWYFALSPPPPQLRIGAKSTGQIGFQMPSYLASPPPQFLLPPTSGSRSTGQIGLQMPWYLASPPPQQQYEYMPATKRPRLDHAIYSNAAVTNDVFDHCSDSDDGKPKAKEDSSLIGAIITITSLLEKPRFQTPIATVAAEVATNTASPGVAMAPPHPPADVDDDKDSNTDYVMDTQSKPRATGASGCWTPKEDAELTSAVANNTKRKWNNEYWTDWAAVSPLVPGRTRNQCFMRWQNDSNPNIARTTGCVGKWTQDEDIKLRHAVQIHSSQDRSGKHRLDWGVITALVPGRTRRQCASRWHEHLKHSITRSTGRVELWTTDEDNKLKDAVQMHGGKDWAATAALIPGRTKGQCYSRWYDVLTHSIDGVAGRAGNWTDDEDIKLKDAVQTHGGRTWGAIAALIPGRTKTQCSNRWHNNFDHSTDGATGRTEVWTTDEHNKLKDAVQMHGGNDWVAIAALVPGRTKKQCTNRWYNTLGRNTDGATGRSGRWTEDEDSKLKDAVQMHGGKDWAATAALIPGRSKEQCWKRWHGDFLNSSNDQATKRSGRWREDEDDNLADAVEMHGGKDWVAIAALVPGRTKKQCKSRCYYVQFCKPSNG